MVEFKIALSIKNERFVLLDSTEPPPLERESAGLEPEATLSIQILIENSLALSQKRSMSLRARLSGELPLTNA